MNTSAILSLARRQRGLLGDLLATLTDAEWEAATLCSGWRVRDVVAHCIQSHRATLLAFLGEWITSGFSLDARNQRGVERLRSLPPAEVLAEYRATAEWMRFPQWEASGALLEAVVHGYDIAIPLERHIEVPAASLVVVANACVYTPFVHSRRRSRGLGLRATDIAWVAGSGPEVDGPLTSIIMAVNGRTSALDDLTGPGVAVLRSRLRSRT